MNNKDKTGNPFSTDDSSPATDSTESKQISVLEVITSKETTESIFKNLVWFLACSGLLKFSLQAIHSHNTPVAWATFILFVMLCSLNMIYGVRYILIPIDSAFEGKLVKLREKNSEPQQKNITNMKRTLDFFVTKVGLFYISISALYMWLAFTLIGLSVKTIT